MLKAVKTALYLSTCGMVLSGYLALAATQDYGISMLLIPIAVFALVPLAEMLDGRYRAYRHITTALTYAYTIAIPVSWNSYGLFPTVVALVIYIQAYKLLHRKEEHDYHHIFLMSFFLLVAACVLSPDATIAIPFLTFLISAVASFFALHVHDEARRCTGSCEIDVVPLHLRRPTYGKRREHFMDGSLLASYTAITLACILMTSAFFIATPRMQAGVFGGTTLQPIRQFTGLADSVDLSQGGPRELNTSPVMRVYLPEEPEGRFNGELYWRNTSFDRYNDKGWDNTSEPSRFNDGVSPLRFIAHSGILDRTSNVHNPRLVRQVVYLDDIPAKGLPTMPLPLQIRWKDARLNWDMVKADTTIDVVAARRNSLLYEVVSEVPRLDPEALRTASSDYLGTFEGEPIVDENTYERLTYHNLSPESVALAERVTAPYDNPYDKAVAVERFLSNGEYLYSLASPQNLPNPVDEFIRVTKIGHCELFASAMALMLRSVGIPARVVSGFRGGDWDKADHSYTIRSHMAHLWVEVYFLGHGWVSFDPSAPDATGSGAGNSIRQYVNSKLLKGKMLWYQDVVGYSARSPLSGLQGVTLGILKGLSLPSQILGFSANTPAGVQPILSRDSIAWLLLAGLMMFGLSVLRRRRRDRKNQSRAAVLNRDQLRAIQLFRTVLRKIRRAVPELEGKTAEEIARMLTAQSNTEKAKAAQDLLDAYTETRFGGRPMSRARYLDLRKAARTLTT